MVVQDLWAGADVRWIGPEMVRGGVRLQPGARAVVLDAGHHRVRSIGSLSPVAGTMPSRSEPGVVIRLSDGVELTVPREFLELVAPDHPLVAEPDATLASWWLEQLDPWGLEHGVPVSSLVPVSFPSVCQVLHPWPGPEGEPILWREVAEHPGIAELRDRLQTRADLVQALAEEMGLNASTGELDEGTAEVLVEVLGRHTSTPDDVFVAVWEGWGDVSAQRFPGAAHLDTQQRGHFLLRGPLTGVLRSIAVSSFDRPVAGLWWPADRAWFVATEIDFEWTFVAGETALVDQLLTDDRLEVARADFFADANRAAGPE